MPQTYYDSELTGAQIESALEAIDGVVTPSNNGKILRVKDGSIEAVSASEYTSGIEVEPLSVTANDTYTAPAGKAYSPVTVNVSGGGGGGDLPSGGSDGDVLIKSGTGAAWTNTPPQMGSLAYINTGSTADKLYNPGEYLVYNGQLYKVTETISQGQTLNPGPNGNIVATNAGDELSNLNIAKDVTLTGSQYWNYGMQASSAKRIGHLISLQIFGRNLDTKVPPSSGGVFTTIGHIDCLPISPISVITHFDGADAQFRIETNGDILYYNYSTTARTVNNAYICFLAY